MLDVSIQLYGHVIGVIRLAQDNGLAVTADLAAGQHLTYDTSAPQDLVVATYYADRGIQPAMGDLAVVAQPTQQGIGFEIIESTLNVY